MRKKGKSIEATETGISLIGTIQNELLKSAELTGQWEKKLRMIEKNTFETGAFMTELKEMVSSIVESERYSYTYGRTVKIENQPEQKGEKKAK